MNIFFNLQFFGIILLCSGSAVAAVEEHHYC